ncbi:MAG: ribonuclease P protein component [Thermodesulfobacteriota bacterium]
MDRDPEAGLPKKNLVTKRHEYQKVYRQGMRLKGDRFSLIILPNNLGYNRLGISIHGVKKAVCRNRLKRIIRETFRLKKHSIAPSQDIVFAVRKNCPFHGQRDIEKAMIELLQKQGLLKAEE